MKAKIAECFGSMLARRVAGWVVDKSVESSRLRAPSCGLDSSGSALLPSALLKGFKNVAATTQTIDINVPRDDFFDVIRDYARYPEFLDEMESVRVIRSEGGVSDVEFTLNVIK